MPGRTSGCQGAHLGARVHIWMPGHTSGHQGTHLGAGVHIWVPRAHIWVPKCKSGCQGAHLGAEVHIWALGCTSGRPGRTSGCRGAHLGAGVHICRAGRPHHQRDGEAGSSVSPPHGDGAVPRVSGTQEPPRLAPLLAQGGFLPPGARPRWRDGAVPPWPEGPGVRSGSKGHRGGRGVTSPPALPRYSAVTGHAVASGQPRCAAPGEETARDGCQPRPALHRRGVRGPAAGSPPRR